MLANRFIKLELFRSVHQGSAFVKPEKSSSNTRPHLDSLNLYTNLEKIFILETTDMQLRCITNISDFSDFWRQPITENVNEKQHHESEDGVLFTLQR